MHNHIYNAPLKSDATRKASIMQGIDSGFVINYYERDNNGHMRHKLRHEEKSNRKAIKFARQLVGK